MPARSFIPTISSRLIRWPHVFAAAGNSSDEELHANPALIVVAGRIMAIRRMGKASFFHIQDRRGRLQVYARKDKLGDDGYGLFQSFDIGDLVGVSRPSVSHQDQGADCRGRWVAAARQVSAAAAGEMAWSRRCRGALPPALRRSDGQSRGPRRVRKALAHRPLGPAFFRRARLSRSRDADDAVDSRRRRGETVS